MTGSRLISLASVGIALMSLIMTVPFLGWRRLRPSLESAPSGVPTSRHERGAYAFRYQNRLAVYWFPLLAIVCVLAVANLSRGFPPRQDAASHIALAEQSSTRGNLTNAVNEYSVALAIDPNSVDAYVGRGIVLRKQGRLRESIDDLTKAIRLEPHNLAAQLNRGLAYLGLGAFRRAIRDFTVAIRLDRTLTEAYINRGYSYKQMRRFDAALRDFDRAVRLAPNSSAPYLGRGLVYGTIGKDARARTDLEKVMKLSSDPVETLLARRQLAELTAKANSRKRAANGAVIIPYERYISPHSQKAP